MTRATPNESRSLEATNPMVVCDNAPSRAVHLLPVSLLLGFMMLAAMLRLYRIDLESAWWDEIVSIQFLHAPTLLDFLRQLRGQDPPMMPLYFVLQYGWASYISGTVTDLRLLSVLFGVLTVPVVFLVGRRLAGPWAGVVAAGCIALAPVHICYSQEIRMYPLITLLSALSAWTFLRLVHAPSRGAWLAHITVNAFLLWAHLFAGLVLLPEAAVLAFNWRRAPKQAILWSLAHACLLIPVALWAAAIDFEATSNASGWMRLPTRQMEAAILMKYAGAERTHLDPSAPAWIGAARPYFESTFSAILLLAAILLLVKELVRRRSASQTGPPLPGTGQAALFALLWLFLPAMLLTAVSYAWKPCLVDRYTLFSSLGVYWLLGCAVAALPRAGQLRAIACASLLVIYGFYATADLYSRPLRSDWRGVADLIQSEQASGNVVYVPYWPLMPNILFHFHSKDNRVVLEKDIARLAASAESSFKDHRIVWVVMPLRSPWVIYTEPESARKLALFQRLIDSRGLHYQQYRFPSGWADAVVFRLEAHTPL